MKKLTTATMIATMVLAPAAAARDDRTTICERAYGVRMAVIKKHGKRAPGRNICRWGVLTKKGARKATVLERARYLGQLRRLNKPVRSPYLVRVVGPPKQPPGGAMTPSVTGGGILQRIAQCESGGNPRAIGGGGRYRGLLQFDQQTWESVGGTGDPAAASPAEQYRRGAILLARRGTQPWPTCGR